jgi:hypothetical protein
MMVGAVPGPAPTETYLGLQGATLTLEATMSDGKKYTKALGTTHSTATWEPGKTYNIVTTITP